MEEKANQDKDSEYTGHDEKSEEYLNFEDAVRTIMGLSPEEAKKIRESPVPPDPAEKKAANDSSDNSDELSPEDEAAGRIMTRMDEEVERRGKRWRWDAFLGRRSDDISPTALRGFDRFTEKRIEEEICQFRILIESGFDVGE